MISTEKTKIHTYLQSIDEALAEEGKVYKTCLDFSKFVASLDKKIMDYKSQLLQISHAYNPTSNLTSSLQGPILAVMDQLLKLEKERDSVIRRATKIWNFIGPRLDNLLCHKIKCIIVGILVHFV